MAKKLRPAPQLQGEAITQEALIELDRAIREYGLVGDIVFEPPLPPDELRRRFGYGIPIEERMEQARRQIADGSAWD